MSRKERRRMVIPVILVLLSLGLLVFVILNKYTRTRSLNLIVSEGNDLLAFDDYEGAKAVYDRVLAQDPDNSAAYEGLMQLAYKMQDREMLTDYYDKWLDIQIAKGNTSDPQIDMMGRIINDMERRKELNGISDMLISGDEEEAQEALKSLAATGKNEEADKVYADMMIYLAQKDIDLKNYDRAAEYLNKALPYAGEDQKAGDLLYDLEVKRLEAAIERHDITAAEEIIKREGIEGYEAVIRSEKERVEYFKSAAAQLKDAFDAEDTALLYGLMNDEELKKEARELVRPFIIQGQAMGAGSIGYYSVNNRLYVYYGTIKEGLREGDGRWTFIASDGRLVVYSLKFAADRPEGEGSCDRYSAPSEEEGATSTHEHDEFTVSGGVMDGKYSMKTEVISEWPYEYSVEYDLKNGYCPRIEPGEYPELIDTYLAYPAPLAGWTEAEVYDPVWKKEYTTTIWFNWTPARIVVEGIETGIAPAEVR